MRSTASAAAASPLKIQEVSPALKTPELTKRTHGTHETVQKVGVVRPLSETGGAPNAPRQYNLGQACRSRQRSGLAGDRPEIWESCRFGKGQVGGGDPVKSMAQPGTEGAVIDRAPNLEQQISASS